MKLEKKWYNLISFIIFVVFALTVYRLMSVIIQVELGHLTMNTALKEELHSALWYLSIIAITLFIRKKDNNHTPLKSEA